MALNLREQFIVRSRVRALPKLINGLVFGGCVRARLSGSDCSVGCLSFGLPPCTGRRSGGSGGDGRSWSSFRCLRGASGLWGCLGVLFGLLGRGGLLWLICGFARGRGRSGRSRHQAGKEDLQITG